MASVCFRLCLLFQRRAQPHAEDLSLTVMQDVDDRVESACWIALYFRFVIAAALCVMAVEGFGDRFPFRRGYCLDRSVRGLSSYRLRTP